MRRAIAVLTLAVAGVPASAKADGLELRLGGFFPRGKTGAVNDLFADHSEIYNVGRSDWKGVSGGLEYSRRLARNFEAGFHIDAYDRTVDTHYRNYVRQDDSEIFQTLRLNIVPIGVSLRAVPTSRRARLAPYVSVGADLFIYRYEAFGDFVDILGNQDIFYDSFVTTGVAPGFHLAGGLRVPFSDDFSVTGEYRYQIAEDDMGGDFNQNRIDLSGGSFTIGLHLRF